MGHVDVILPHHLSSHITLPCIFRCAGTDNVAHYLRCDCLWSLLLSVVGAHWTHLSDSPSQRACLEGVSPFSILKCWYAFQLYHALKLDHRCVIDAAVAE